MVSSCATWPSHWGLHDARVSFADGRLEVVTDRMMLGGHVPPSHWLHVFRVST
jgi:hypothetical protein